MEIRTYTTYLTEAIDLDDIYEGIGESFIDLKKDIIDLINNTLEESDIKDTNKQDLNSFMSEYIALGKESDMIDHLIEDNDIFNFYLKHQSDFDEFLNDTGYMEKSPQENNVFSLYDVILDGTKQGILNLVEIIQNEIFSE